MLNRARCFFQSGTSAIIIGCRGGKLHERDTTIIMSAHRQYSCRSQSRRSCSCSQPPPLCCRRGQRHASGRSRTVQRSRPRVVVVIAAGSPARRTLSFRVPEGDFARVTITRTPTFMRRRKPRRVCPALRRGLTQAQRFALAAVPHSRDHVISRLGAPAHRLSTEVRHASAAGCVSSRLTRLTSELLLLRRRGRR